MHSAATQKATQQIVITTTVRPGILPEDDGGAAVGGTVGTAVGATVGDVVGAAVGACVGVAVGTAVGA